MVPFFGPKIQLNCHPVGDDEEGELALVGGDLESCDEGGHVVRRAQEGAEQRAVVRRRQAAGGGLPALLHGVEFVDVCAECKQASS